MHRQVTSLLIAVAVLYCGWLLLAITGITGTINADLPDLWTPGYIWPVLLHAFYGVVLFAAIVATGVSVLHLTRKLLSLDDSDIRILGFPVGMIVCLCVAIVAQLGVTGQTVALLTMLATFAYYGTFTRGKRLASNQYIALVVILAVAMGAHFSFMWKPTLEGHTGSTGIADAGIYSGWYYSLKVSLYPFYNLGSEGEESIYRYFNNLHTFYALGLDFLPRFNIYLFNMTSISTCSVLATAYALRAFSLYRSGIGLAPLTWISRVLITVLFIAAARYPTWLIESPPVAFMTPITLAVLYAVRRAGDNVVKLGVALILAVIGSAISKVVTLAVLGAYTGIKLLQWIFLRGNLVGYALLGVMTATICYYIFEMVRNFGPVFATDWDAGPEFWPRFVDKGWGEFHKVIPKLLKDLGLVIIVACTWKLKDRALFIASLLAVATHFLFPFLFTPTPASFLILLAGYIMTVGQIGDKVQLILLLAALAILPHHFRHDPGSWHALLLWTLTLGTTVYITLLSGSPGATISAGPGWTKWGLVLGTLLVVTLSLAALANNNLRIGKKKLELIPLALNDIWLNTRQRTPRDALIFTDQTGVDRGRLSGWNDYSLMAQRQFYISTWATGPLRVEPGALQQRFANNEAIISGELAPIDLSLSRRYDSYFAVLSSRKTVPPTFNKVYKNSDYALYEIQVNAQAGP